MNRKTVAIILLGVSLLLAACGGAPAANGDGGSAEEPGTESEPINIGPVLVSATGEVLPAEQAQLAFLAGGQVAEIMVEEGDVVSEGDVLIQLDTTILETNVTKAEAALDVAVANLEIALIGAREEQVAEAKANAAASAANTGVADAVRDQANADPTDQDLARAQAAVQQAYIQFIQARNQRDYVNNATVHPDEYTVWERAVIPNWAGDAEEDYAIALRGLEAAQARLDRLISGPSPENQAALDADMWAAAADYQAAQANVALLESGPRDEDIAVAEAAVNAQQIALNRALIALENATLTAPFDGTIADVYIRESQHAAAGVPLILIADLSGLRVETTDLNEIDVAAVSVGDAVEVTFDALPGVLVDGTVSRIGEKAEEGTGVNYTVIVDLDEIPDGVRWGMTAFVDIPLDN